MHRYIYNVMLQVEVEAPSDSEADALIEDCYGEGTCAGAEVVNMEILDVAQLA